MNVISQKRKDNYIKNHGLEDSFLPVNILYMCRGTLPKRLEVGCIGRNKIFFEEGISSLKRRFYKKQDKVTSWNLVYEGQLLDKEFLIKHKDEITLNGLYDYNFLFNFFETKSKKVNPLNPVPEEKKKIRWQKWLTKEEIGLVNEFVKRLRARNN